MSGITEERGVNAYLIRSYVNERFGDAGVEKVTELLSKDAKEMFISTDANRWYPVQYMREIYHAVDKAFGDKNPGFFKDLGRHGVEVSIKGFLRFLVRNLISVEQLLKRTNAFWKNYHRGGEIITGKVTTSGSRSQLKVSIKGFNIAPQACVELEGYMEKLIEKAGAVNIRINKEKCIHRGDDLCVWEISWEK